jgi:dihydroorotate dehydrogenase (fumarate)
MDLVTSYLGLNLPHPLIVGASPMANDLDLAKRLEDAGAAAIVMQSLFEEQITREELGTIQDMELHAESNAEALSYFPNPEEFHLGTDNYLEQVRKLKASLKIPVIGSLNGTTASGWLQYARQIEQAGADALELNLYYLPTSPLETGDAVERRTLESVRIVKESVKIPVAVKLSPYFSSLPHLAKVLEGAGADGLVLFNRFLQPDIDIENLEVSTKAEFSSPASLRLRLRWLAILHGSIQIPMVASGGVHTVEDVIKSIMAGASAVQMVSALYRNGPEHLKKLKTGISQWLSDHEYDSLSQAKGSMSLQKSPNPAAFERAQYMRVLTGWKV